MASSVVLLLAAAAHNNENDDDEARENAPKEPSPAIKLLFAIFSDAGVDLAAELLGPRWVIVPIEVRVIGVDERSGLDHCWDLSAETSGLLRRAYCVVSGHNKLKGHLGDRVEAWLHQIVFNRVSSCKVGTIFLETIRDGDLVEKLK